MSDSSAPPPNPPAPAPEPEPVPLAPVIHRAHHPRGVSIVWFIPIVAALLGLWLVWQHYSGKGPLVEIRFETAEGIEAAKTGVQCRSVRIGIVETVRLSADLKGVVTTVRIDRSAEGLLRADTRFWVVRPRFGGAGISGLGTLVSGTFLELDPGSSETPEYSFKGLENPPITPQGVPGLHVTLVASKAGSVGPGSPIIYKGIRVGRVESQIFNRQNGRVEYPAFIEGDFGKLVSKRARFWNVSGIDLEMGANGIRVRTGTLESILSGGVAFEIGHGSAVSEPAADGTVFQLYDSQEEFQMPGFEARLTYMLLFKDSVRGLSPDAPVEFRGIRVGTVTGISFEYLPNDPERRVPVIIAIDPALMTNMPSNDLNAAAATMVKSVKEGLRATLRTGSLLTGQLFVDLDLQPDAPAAEVVDIGGYATLPTVSSGLARLQDKFTAVLDKIQALKLEATVEKATGALAAIESAVKNLDKVIDSKETRALPADLRKSLGALEKTLRGFNENSDLYRDLLNMITDLRSALRSVDSLSSTIERQPNSLLFGNPKGKVKPPVGKP